MSGPFDPGLAAAGQAVILARRPGVPGVVALAWRRKLEASGPDDPQLHEFAEAYLGPGRQYAAVTRTSAHRRPASSVTSTSQTAVVRPR